MKYAVLTCIYNKIQVCASLPTDSTTPSFWYTKAQVLLESNHVFQMLSSALNWDLNLHSMSTVQSELKVYWLWASTLELNLKVFQTHPNSHE